MKPQPIILLLFYTFSCFLYIPAYALAPEHENQNESLSVGMELNFSPYEFLIGNAPSGFNVDLEKEIGQELNVDLEWHPKIWPEVLESLQNEEVDFITAVKSESRDEYLDFSQPFLNMSARIFINQDAEELSSIDETANHTIGVIDGVRSHQYLQENVPEAVLVLVDTFDQLVSLLIRGEVWAIFVAEYAMKYSLNTFYKDLKIKPTASSIFMGEYCFAVKEGNTALIGRLDTALSTLMLGTEYSEIYNNWFALDSIREITAFEQFFINNWTYLILGMAIVFTSLLMWNRTLKNQVYKKTKQLEQSQDMLFQQDKMQSIALLAGGIAHDFNNSLTVILGSLSLLQLECKEESEEIQILQNAVNAAKQAESLAGQLLTFTKHHELKTKVCSVIEPIENAVKFTFSGSNCTYSLDFDKGLWNCIIDQEQISQVINNLGINAIQAMPQGGHIVIRGENQVLKKMNHILLKEEHYVRISMQDNGPGIPPEVIKKIFDPYFTTKNDGNGLGLSHSYSIIDKHGGHLQVESKLGEGAMFYFHLPAIAE